MIQPFGQKNDPIYSKIFVWVEYRCVSISLLVYGRQTCVHLHAKACPNNALHSSSISCVDMANGTVGEMDKLGITESYLVKRQVLLSAAEAAEMILRVDDIIKAPPRFGSHDLYGISISFYRFILQKANARSWTLMNGYPLHTRYNN